MRAPITAAAATRASGLSACSARTPGQDLLGGSGVGPHPSRQARCLPDDPDPLAHLMLVGKSQLTDGLAEAAARPG